MTIAQKKERRNKVYCSKVLNDTHEWYIILRLKMCNANAKQPLIKTNKRRFMTNKLRLKIIKIDSPTPHQSKRKQKKKRQKSREQVGQIKYQWKDINHIDNNIKCKWYKYFN